METLSLLQRMIGLVFAILSGFLLLLSIYFSFAFYHKLVDLEGRKKGLIYSTVCQLLLCLTGMIATSAYFPEKAQTFICVFSGLFILTIFMFVAQYGQVKVAEKMKLEGKLDFLNKRRRK